MGPCLLVTISSGAWNHTYFFNFPATEIKCVWFQSCVCILSLHSGFNFNSTSTSVAWKQRTWHKVRYLVMVSRLKQATYTCTKNVQKVYKANYLLKAKGQWWTPLVYSCTSEAFVYRRSRVGRTLARITESAPTSSWYDCRRASCYLEWKGFLYRLLYTNVCHNLHDLESIVTFQIDNRRPL